MSEPLKKFLKGIPPLLWAVRRFRAYRRDSVRQRRSSPSVYHGQITRYLESTSNRKLQIGSGPIFLPGWLNTDYEPVSDDFVYLDATKPLPLPDQSFECVFSEHLIEHIDYAQGLALLRECFRVLKPGGRIRIATPNLKNILALYGPDKTDSQKRYYDWTLSNYYPDPKVKNDCFVVNNFMHSWGHQFVYDVETLKDSFERVGFRDVKACAPGQSDDERLRGVEHHGERIGEEWNLYETMVLEATKPV